MRLLRAALFVLFALSRAAVARADEPTLQQKKAARESLRLGDEWLKKGELDKAAEQYRQADDIMQVPTTGIEVVRIELKRGHLKEAFQACNQVAHYPEKNTEPPPFARARKEARELLPALKKRIPRLDVQIRGLSADTLPRVTVDDAPVDNYADYPVNPGAHQVMATAKGYLTQTQDIDVAEGDHKSVFITLARVKTKEIKLAPTYWPLTYTGFAVAGAGLIAGIATGVLALNESSYVRDNCPAPPCDPNAIPDLNDRKDRWKSLAYGSTASFAIAGVGALVGVTGLVLSLRAKKKNEAAPAVAVVPMFDAKGAVVGAGVVGKL